ncbi:MAG: hypothetical protein CMF71_02400 [Magnetovibrio sp.]|nr:hypothetical protein [Magnetovibrio sp.]
MNLIFNIMAKMIQKHINLLFFLFASVLLTTSCTSKSSNTFGEDKPAPDEFAVYSRAPLSVPPDFGLRPPEPGATRPQTIISRDQAKKALFSQSAPAVNTITSVSDQTPGINALLNKTGANQAKKNIRALVNSETAGLSSGEDGGVAETILFWRKNDTKLKGAVIDPAFEQRRLRRTLEEGNTIDEGPAPIIQRPKSKDGKARKKKEKSFWGSLFD